MEREYNIATYLLTVFFSDPGMMVNCVMQEFDLSRQEAVAILDSKSFNKTLDGLIRLRDMTNRARMLNTLGEAIKNGSNREKMFAIDTLIYLRRSQKYVKFSR